MFERYFEAALTRVLGADYGGVDHVIWHLFVLLGSALHYNAILRYLVWAPPVVP